MRGSAVVLLVLSPLLPGCLAARGIFTASGVGATPIVGKSATIDHCERWLRPRRTPLMYCGSDRDWHYFASRPADDFALYRIARDELSLPDERPVDPDHRTRAYYAVDYRNRFAKLE